MPTKQKTLPQWSLGTDDYGATCIYEGRDIRFSNVQKMHNNFTKEEIAHIVKAHNEHAALAVLATFAKQMLNYIEMKIAHDGAMSVEQIKEALTRAQTVSHIETAHHLGCPTTTRRVDLAEIRNIIAEVETMRGQL